MNKLLVSAGLVAASLMPLAASAHGGVSVDLGIGLPVYGAPAPAYYAPYPPPAYYGNVYGYAYAPPPAYYGPRVGFYGPGFPYHHGWGPGYYGHGYYGHRGW